ncbi:S4 domain-containing protein, partial [Paenibacillus sp. GCM10012307]
DYMNKFLKLLITLKLCTILIEEYYEKQHYTNKNPIVVNETENIEEEFHSIYKIESKFIKRKSDWLYPIFFRSKKKLNLNKSNSAINVLGLPVRPINFLYSYSDFLSAYSQRNKQSPSSYRIKEYADIIQTLKKFSLFYGSISTKKIIFYLAEAKKMPGNYTKNFLCLIESRLDIAIYRSGFAPSIAAARCLCSQGHVYINSKKVTTPGILLKSGDVIKVREISNISKKLENSLNFDLLNIEPFSLQQIQINEVQQLINKLENKTSFINFDTSYAKDKFNSLKKSLFYLNSSS